MAVLRACPVGLANNYDDGVDVDTGAFVNDIQAKCIDEDKKGWVVTVQYGPYDPEINPASPLDRALQISLGRHCLEEIADWDKDHSIRSSTRPAIHPTRRSPGTTRQPS